VINSDKWLCSNSLGLNGILAEEWNNYTKGLSTAGVILGESNDKLMWTGGDASGKTTSQKYLFSSSFYSKFPTCGDLESENMEVGYPIKDKTFHLVDYFPKILTWDGLQKRGWEGPSLCVLCKRNSENLEHLFIDCSFTKHIWAVLKYLLNLKRTWTGQDIVDCYRQWINDKSVLPELAALTCWGLWLERNKCIFENVAPSVHSVLFKILGLYRPNNPSLPQSLTKECFIQYEEGSSIAFFDGATRSDRSSCGAGGVIKVY
jgi:hypothetical protein